MHVNMWRGLNKMFGLEGLGTHALFFEMYPTVLPFVLRTWMVPEGLYRTQIRQSSCTTWDSICRWTMHVQRGVRRSSTLRSWKMSEARSFGIRTEFIARTVNTHRRRGCPTVARAGAVACSF